MDQALADIGVISAYRFADADERMERLQEVTYPKPNAELIYATFDAFRDKHPWVQQENVHPKSIGRAA